MDSLKPCPFCGGEAHTRLGGGWWVYCSGCTCEIGFEGMDENGCWGSYGTEAEAAEAWNTRAATTIGQVAVEVVPTKRTCRLEPLNAFYTDLNGLNQTEWGVCSNCGTASPIDATYCCKCGMKVER